MLITPGCPEGNWYSEGNNTVSVCISGGSQLKNEIKSPHGHVTTPQAQTGRMHTSTHTVYEKMHWHTTYNIH